MYKFHTNVEIQANFGNSLIPDLLEDNAEYFFALQ